MSIERTQAGSQSATFLLRGVEDYDLTIVAWSALPEGKLKNILNSTYLTSEGAINPEAFMDAFARAGGSADLTVSSLAQVVNGYSGGCHWYLANRAVRPSDPVTGSPILRVRLWPLDAAVGGAVVRIAASYSASE